MTYLLIALAVLLIIILIIVLIPSSNDVNTAKSNYCFLLKAGNKTLKFTDPFDNFLVYGGANSGKTKSIGKPLLSQYIEAKFAGLIYDYKDYDLTNTAHHFVKKTGYPYAFYYLSFMDLNRTHRTNPIDPSILDENLFLQVIDDLLTAYNNGEGAKRDEWFNGALGILKGIAIRFYKSFPEICTIPHICIYACSAGATRITEFVENSIEARILASAFLDAKDSPKTQSSYLSSLTNLLSPLAFNKQIAYVLSGSDFRFNLIDPEEPKLVSVVNSYQIENVLSPIIALMVSVSSRRFTMDNKVDFVYFFDEATTFRISDFEKMPSVLREYKCSFTFLTQSASKVEKKYGRLDRSSIEANFGNQFYGRTKDIEALKTYPSLFGKYDKMRTSQTRGSSKGGANRSRTTSTHREDVYETDYFTKLKSGEFVGVTAHSNMQRFSLHFDMYQEEEDKAPAVRYILPEEVESNYTNILHRVLSL